MTREEYRAVVGVEPLQDDLVRANCPNAGTVGHYGCGVCVAHRKPVFTCMTCFGQHEPIDRLLQVGE